MPSNNVHDLTPSEANAFFAGLKQSLARIEAKEREQ
jgi:hypothetical protein